MASTYADYAGSTVGAAGITGYTPSSIWGGYSPGRYMRAGKTHKASMDSGFATLFEGARDKGNSGIGSFEEFMAMKKNPEGFINRAVSKHSPDFVLAQMKFAQ